jgi:hypothetical protein
MATVQDDTRGTYLPLDTLKPVADDVWLVDGPIIRFGMPWPKLPFPTRMTIMRLAGGELLVHSPTPLVPSLRRELEDIGRPRWIVAPNRIHYWWVPEWHAAYPDAEVYLAPRITEQAGDHIDFATLPLDRDRGYPWDAEIESLPVQSNFMTEVEFFHRRSRTLVLTDLVENFEPRKLDSWVMRWLTRLGGVQDPDGQMPRDMRHTFGRHRPALRAAVETMIGWNPKRVVLAHGRWYPSHGADELRRAFRWLLG